MSPLDEFMKSTTIHSTCPHTECKTAHEKIERQEEYAPSILLALLLTYCAVCSGAVLVNDVV